MMICTGVCRCLQHVESEVTVKWLSKRQSILTWHNLLQKQSWSRIKRGHPRRGPPSQHPVLYHRNSCWNLQRVQSGGRGGNPGVCDVAFKNCVFEKHDGHDNPQVCDVHSRVRHRLGDCQLSCTLQVFGGHDYPQVCDVRWRFDVCHVLGDSYAFEPATSKGNLSKETRKCAFDGKLQVERCHV